MSWSFFQPRPTVAQRQALARKEAEKLEKKGRKLSPVLIDGRKITSTFWGNAWCKNIESYRDFEYRLPRGRSYARNGSIIDLQIAAGKITALVAGSSVYTVTINIQRLRPERWAGIRVSCAGKIASVIELLQGRISSHVMEIVTNQSTGLFPAPAEIEIKCSCPDWANLCKHAAAVLYGVGARLDTQPDLLFMLRHADHLELVAGAVNAPAPAAQGTGGKTIEAADIADVFGIELAATAPASATPAGPGPSSTPQKRVPRSSAARPVASRAKKRQPTRQPQGKKSKTAPKRAGRTSKKLSRRAVRSSKAAVKSRAPTKRKYPKRSGK